jgi:hypothetical protein
VLKKGREFCNTVCVIATCRGRNTLHKSLVLARGQHLFSSVIEMKSPNQVSFDIFNISVSKNNLKFQISFFTFINCYILTECRIKDISA